MAWKCTQGGRIMANGHSLASCAIRLLGMKLVWVSTGKKCKSSDCFWYVVVLILMFVIERCIMWKKSLSVSSVANLSRDRLRCQRICWYTRTPGRIHVSFVENDFIKSRIWKSTPIFIPVSAIMYLSYMNFPQFLVILILLVQPSNGLEIKKFMNN